MNAMVAVSMLVIGSGIFFLFLIARLLWRLGSK
jgi:hypothetical protein